jgi:hypothetical protein
MFWCAALKAISSLDNRQIGQYNGPHEKKTAHSVDAMTENSGKNLAANAGGW